MGLVNPTQRRSKCEIGMDILWGWGLGLGACFLLSAIAGLAFLGDLASNHESLPAFSEVIGAYFAGTFAGGTILGLVRPWAKGRIAGGVIGFVIGALLYGSIGLTMQGDDSLLDIVIQASVLGFLVGVPAGLLCRELAENVVGVAFGRAERERGR